MNPHIRFFHALTGAGLSPYQAEWVVRKAATVGPANSDIQAGRFNDAFLHGCTWAWIPGTLPGLSVSVHDKLCAL